MSIDVASIDMVSEVNMVSELNMFTLILPATLPFFFLFPTLSVHYGMQRLVGWVSWKQ